MRAGLLKPCVFLDRDGVVTKEKGYINHPSRLELESMAAGAIRRLNEAGVLAVITSNQAGVARGYFSMEVLEETSACLEELLRNEGARLDDIHYAPYHPAGIEPCWREDPEALRKPGLGMIRRAQAKLPVDLARSYVIGDRINDITFAHHAGLPGILVKTGMGLGEFTYQRDQWSDQPDHIAKDIADAVHWILKNMSR